MSAHPFGRQPGDPPRRDHAPAFVRIAAIAALATIVAVGALVVGIDLWGAR